MSCPFAGLAFAGLFAGSPLDEQAGSALAAYGAVILSFLGGVQWGLAIANGPDGSAMFSRRLGMSVVPSLLGWVALLLPISPGLLMLALAFGLVLLVDLRSTRHPETPIWYPRLRWPLTSAVVLSLFLGASV